MNRKHYYNLRRRARSRYEHEDGYDPDTPGSILYTLDRYRGRQTSTLIEQWDWIKNKMHKSIGGGTQPADADMRRRFTSAYMKRNMKADR